MTKATVKIDLPDNGEVELVPTLAAMEYLNKQADNFQAVFAKLGSMNFEMYAHVIKAGLLGHPTFKNAKISEIKDEVYNAGVISLMEPLIRYVSILLNGGKEPTKTDEESEEAKGENPEL